MRNPDKEATELLMPYEDQFSAEKYNTEGYAVTGRLKSLWQRLLPWCIHLGLVVAYTAVFFAVQHREKGAAGVFSLVDCTSISSLVFRPRRS